MNYCTLIGVVVGCAVALPFYNFGWWWRGRFENREAPRCYLSHRWSAYEPPMLVGLKGETCDTTAQRRECSRCKAEDYRLVPIHD